MIKILKNPAQIVTVNTGGVNYKRGSEASDIGVIEDHSIIIEDGFIADIVPSGSIKHDVNHRVIDVDGKTVFPGFVECHTHSAFAGSRADEYRMKLQGISYEEIARAGGGILSTVNSVRSLSAEEIYAVTKPRVQNFISQGVTTLEIKSGYGLDFDNEIKLLNVVSLLEHHLPITFIKTFLGAHAIPPEFKEDREGYVDLVVDKMLPYMCMKKGAKFVDVFTEKTAFTADETDRIFEKAAACGMKIKIHTEQFNNVGGLEVALKHNAVSVDHLEVLKDEQIEALAKSDTVAVLLPGVSYFLRYDYAPARKLLEADAVVALATDLNPGSSNINNIFLIMSLAASNMKMSVEEIISAYTINAAKALMVNEERGSIEIGKKADFAILDIEDYSEIVYQPGANLCVCTIKDGEIVYLKEQNLNEHYENY